MLDGACGVISALCTSTRGNRLKKLMFTILALALSSNVTLSNPAPARASRYHHPWRNRCYDGWLMRVIENGSVAVKGERIVAVGTASEITARYVASRVINATGKVVMPGLINTHGHVPMVLFRGIADDLVLMDWLQKFIFPAEAKNVDEQFVRWGTRLVVSR